MSDKHKKNKDLFKSIGQQSVHYVSNSESIDDSTIKENWTQLQNALPSPFYIKHKNILIYTASVASLLFVVILSFFLLTSSNQTSELAISSFSDVSNLNSEEIILVTNDQQHTISNESNIKYDNNGDLVINDKKIEATESEINHLIVPYGKHASIILSDGSHVFLNAGSQITYPTRFASDRREIGIQGEVYLEVAKDSKHPFIVKTENFDIKVLGTSFNIKAYKNESASVVLVEGLVEVSFKKQKIKIEPSQMLDINADNFNISYVDVNEFIAWKDDIMYLTNKKCGCILNSLSKYYGVKIIYNQDVANIPVGGKLNLRKGLENTMTILNESFGLKYSVDESGNINVYK